MSHDVQPAIRIARKFVKEGPSPLVNFYGINAVCGGIDKRAGEAARSWADFYNAAPGEVTA
ncbi:hypothetical protein AA106555_0190 [Neokomagataea thailandica NBRC 106555]|uniref:Uncharacterized protein n=1 Tax=Neokomagataea thailandica NBRC 106555 TaxID=1223520 RepID=A0ABQ0QME4_9PROT|nr:hypothetical protein AA106555_0190 [Neokomagataea thailandica NBRC 106555]